MADITPVRARLAVADAKREARRQGRNLLTDEGYQKAVKIEEEVSARRQLPGHRGHPARRTRRDKRQEWRQPDATEASVQYVNRVFRQKLKELHTDDGVVGAILAVGAQYIAPQIGEQHGFDSHEHHMAIAHWLNAKFGDAIRDFDPDAYLAWRKDCRQRAEAAWHSRYT
jgi:hypothetical protein